MNRETAYQELLKRTGMEDKDIFSAYMYGSRVYGNARKDSDWDFIVVLNVNTPAYKVPGNIKHQQPYKMQFSDNLINVNFYRIDEHRERCANHEPSALECVFLPEEFILKRTLCPEEHEFNNCYYDPELLRHACSAKSSNSWVKAKKKLTVPQDYDANIGKKSLWHAMRIIDFATQIAKHGKIIDYGSCNHFYDDVMYASDWPELFERYKPKYNAMLTEFRKLAPK